MSTYASFQGRVFLGKRDVAGLPIEVRSPGNVADLKLSLKTDVLEHYESQTGQRSLDHRMVKQKSATVNLTIEEFTKENLALALYGNHVTGSTGQRDRRAGGWSHAGRGRPLLPGASQGLGPRGGRLRRHARDPHPRHALHRRHRLRIHPVSGRHRPHGTLQGELHLRGRRPRSASSRSRSRSGTSASKGSTRRRPTPRCWWSSTGWPSIP